MLKTTNLPAGRTGYRDMKLHLVKLSVLGAPAYWQAS